MIKSKVTLNVNEDAIVKFRRLAAELGYISGSGPLAGHGNQNQLVEAIASGEILIVKNPAFTAASQTEG